MLCPSDSGLGSAKRALVLLYLVPSPISLPIILLITYLRVVAHLLIHPCPSVKSFANISPTYSSHYHVAI
jgi:hypothetical protein